MTDRLPPKLTLTRSRPSSDERDRLRGRVDALATDPALGIEITAPVLGRDRSRCLSQPLSCFRGSDHDVEFSFFINHTNPVAAHVEDEHPPGPIWSRHIVSHATRTKLLAHFQGEDAVDYRVRSNVKLLIEGVDVPGIDAVAFIDTRRGHGSIIRAVGRAVPPSPRTRSCAP